jgi:hypothetical protein
MSLQEYNSEPCPIYGHKGWCSYGEEGMVPANILRHNVALFRRPQPCDKCGNDAMARPTKETERKPK